MLQEARSLDTNNVEIVETLAAESLKQGNYDLAQKTYKTLESFP
jgi:cytochrome c-type biogenesis protein CcmH/NrfG